MSSPILRHGKLWRTLQVPHCDEPWCMQHPFDATRPSGLTLELPRCADVFYLTPADAVHVPHQQPAATERWGGYGIGHASTTLEVACSSVAGVAALMARPLPSPCITPLATSSRLHTRQLAAARQPARATRITVRAAPPWRRALGPPGGQGWLGHRPPRSRAAGHPPEEGCGGEGVAGSAPGRRSGSTPADAARLSRPGAHRHVRGWEGGRV